MRKIHGISTLLEEKLKAVADFLSSDRHMSVKRPDFVQTLCTILQKLCIFLREFGIRKYIEKLVIS